MSVSLLPRPGRPLDDNEDGLVSATRVAEIAGVSYRQLDYWCRVGLLSPMLAGSGSGTRRRFCARDVALARLAALLMRLNRDTLWTGAILDAIADVPLQRWGEHQLAIYPDGRVVLDGEVEDVAIVVRLGSVAAAVAA